MDKIKFPENFKGTTSDLKKIINDETYKMAYTYGLMYYHFAKLLTEKFGKKKGEELISEALKNFALERGEAMRKKADEADDMPTGERFRDYELILKYNDLPAYTWWTDEDGSHCPMADCWDQKGALGRDLGIIFCNVNDSFKEKGFNQDLELFKYKKCRTLGNKICDFENVEFIE